MPKPGKSKALGHSVPVWDDPAGWALWQFSLVLKEISENSGLHADEKGDPVSQTPPEDDATGGTGESNSHE